MSTFSIRHNDVSQVNEVHRELNQLTEHESNVRRYQGQLQRSVQEAWDARRNQRLAQDFCHKIEGIYSESEIDEILRKVFASRSNFHEGINGAERTFSRYRQEVLDWKARLNEVRATPSPTNQAIATKRQELAKTRLLAQRPVTVQLDGLAEKLAEIPNVFGVKIDAYTTFLRLTLGLHDIYMNESTMQEGYPEILLAPLTITVEINSDGHLSWGDCTGRFHRGYSERNAIHPHWLSDGPCLGTFHDTLLDAARSGQFDVFVTVLIMFLQQYNSEDPAGRTFCNFNPNSGEYTFRRTDPVSRHREHWDVIDVALLDEANDRYTTWFEAKRGAPVESVPSSHDLWGNCDDCDAEIVYEDDAHYREGGNRTVCDNCADNYCGICDSHHEDCECQDCHDCDRRTHQTNTCYALPRNSEYEEPICEDCYGDNYFRCEDCGEHFHDNHGTWVDDFEHLICNTCLAERQENSEQEDTPNE